MATNMTSSTCDGFKSIKISPGCIVKCTTCLNELKHGEVVAFDSHQKIMILKLASTNGKKEFSDFSLINMEYVQSIEMMKKIESLPPRLSALNTAKLVERFKKEVSLKLSLAKARSNGVNDDGIMLFTYLRKVLKDSTKKKN